MHGQVESSQAIRINVRSRVYWPVASICEHARARASDPTPPMLDDSSRRVQRCQRGALRSAASSANRKIVELKDMALAMNFGETKR